MKPAAFEYHRAESLDQALELLGRFGDEAKPLAGGQSLVPLLNFRLTGPEHLIDLNRVASLAGIRRVGGTLRIGAMTRQSRLERSPIAAEGWPLLLEALESVAHPQIRNRGTVGGSAVHADPAAELPVALLALEARFHVASAVRGRRTIPVADLFLTHLTTSLEPDEILVEIELPPVPESTGWAFEEFSRRHGDFALGGAAALATVADGRCSRVRVALLGASDTPVRSAPAEQIVTGAAPAAEVAAEAGAAAAAEVTPSGDMHGSTEYRRRLLETMVERALLRAFERAGAPRGE